MKLKLIPAALFLLTAWFARAQGTFIYDQQSTNLIEGAALLNDFGQPMGQSFTPTLSSVSFVMLNLYDGGSLEALGATVFVNLRSDSITGPILSSTAPVFMPNAFFGITNFFFSTPVTVTPGVTYYFQPVTQVGSDSWNSNVTDGSYTGGSEIFQGSPWLGRSLWFREGIIAVPEPSSALLVLLGSGAWLFIRRQREIK